MKALDHVGIAVRSLPEAEAFYERSLGLKAGHRETLASQHVRVAFLEAGSASLELLEPIGPEGAVARFIAERGPGLHHLAFKVDDIRAEMKRLAGQSNPPIEAEPRAGARGHQVCFLHPRRCGGVLLEMVSHG